MLVTFQKRAICVVAPTFLQWGFLLALLVESVRLWAGIHTVPIVIRAKDVRMVQYHPTGMYRLFRSSPDGRAYPIPFQIDEKDKYGDYILNQGPNPNVALSNGIFDFDDELSFMGNDVGPVSPPNQWDGPKPSILYEIKQSLDGREGAVYLGIYYRNPPPLVELTYVKFNVASSEVVTSRYRYRFSPVNYLVVRGVDVTHQSYGKKLLLASSSFYLRADLKWFLTFNINENDVHSEMDAFKDGPIRTIARVNFNYEILKLNFDLGMYTEVSFFSNSVILPAVIDNPLDGQKTLNKGSEFYYGLSLVQNPKFLEIESNMPKYADKSIFDMFKSAKKIGQYWLTATSPETMIYLEMEPSPKMVEGNNIPQFYTEEHANIEIKNRPRAARPLGESPVNMAIAFDLTSLSEGIHDIKFRLFVESTLKPELLEEYKTSNTWKTDARKLTLAEYDKPNVNGKQDPTNGIKQPSGSKPGK